MATDSQVTSSPAQNETSSQIPADLVRFHHPLFSLLGTAAQHPQSYYQQAFLLVENNRKRCISPPTQPTHYHHTVEMNISCRDTIFLRRVPWSTDNTLEKCKEGIIWEPNSFCSKLFTPPQSTINKAAGSHKSTLYTTPKKS